MKQGDRFFRCLALLMASFCLAWLGALGYSAWTDPLTVVTALKVETQVSADATGVIIRDEVLLSSPYAETVPLLAEGEKIGAGQTVALGFSEEIPTPQPEMRMAVEQRVLQLYSAVSGNPAEREKELRGMLLSLACQPLNGDTARLKGLVLGSTADQALLQKELETLRAFLAEWSGTDGGAALKAENSGWFSSYTDGYETVLTPQWLDTLTADLTVPESRPVKQSVYGKLVRSGTWYFAASLSRAQLAELREGSTVTVEFGRSLPEAVSMRIERVKVGSGDTGLLVLSCDRFPDRVTTLRLQSCTVVFRTYSGLRIPRAAVCHNDRGQAGVYVLEGAVARWKPVVILDTDENSCLAALDQTNTDFLWPGDEILLGNNLYDGKVVYP